MKDHKKIEDPVPVRAESEIDDTPEWLEYNRDPTTLNTTGIHNDAQNANMVLFADDSRRLPSAVFDRKTGKTEMRYGLNTSQIEIFGRPIISQSGKWLGDATDLRGPMGPTGPSGLVGPIGPTGPAGPEGPIRSIHINESELTDNVYPDGVIGKLIRDFNPSNNKAHTGLIITHTIIPLSENIANQKYTIFINSKIDTIEYQYISEIKSFDGTLRAPHQLYKFQKPIGQCLLYCSRIRAYKESTITIYYHKQDSTFYFTVYHNGWLNGVTSLNNYDFENITISFDYLINYPS